MDQARTEGGANAITLSEPSQLDTTETAVTSNTTNPDVTSIDKTTKTSKSSKKSKAPRSSKRSSRDKRKRRDKRSSKYTDSSDSSSDAGDAKDQSSDSEDESSSSSDEIRRRKEKKSKSKTKRREPTLRKRNTKSKRREAVVSSSSSSSSSSDLSSDDDLDDSSSDSDSESEVETRRVRKSRRNRTRRSRSVSSDSSSSSSATSSSSEDDEKAKKTLGETGKLKRSDTLRSKRHDKDNENETENVNTQVLGLLKQILAHQASDKNDKKDRKDRKRRGKKTKKAKSKDADDKKTKDGGKEEVNSSDQSQTQTQDPAPNKEESQDKLGVDAKKEAKKVRRGHLLEYKRVDLLWDTDIHDFKLKVSKDQDEREDFDEYAFTVRRVFDWENKYQETLVDIRSKQLREALAEIMKDVKGVSLVEDKPVLDPKMLFLHLEQMRTFYRKTLKARIKKTRKAKQQKKLEKARAQLKLMVEYVDIDFHDTKRKLYPMLKNGSITFDMLWALFRPNTIAYTSTYGATEHPRCFKVDAAVKESNLMRGEYYSLEGRYLEFDGKSFGHGDFEASIDKFVGARKITSLPAYPLEYHSDAQAVRERLIARGKKFVELAGMKYKYHQGLAFHKKKRAVLRLNIDGRCMVDPSLFRRILPNYPISLLTPKHNDDDEDEPSAAAATGDNKDLDGGAYAAANADDEVRTSTRVVRDKDGGYKVVDVNVDENGKVIRLGSHDLIGDADAIDERTFSENDLLTASPVVLGFAFSEKQWMEFTVDGIREIDWNDDAFDSLVIPEDRKSIVKALVSAHRFKASKTIDDVVQGKGKGLVFVLHGPPGCGKTLTCEAIAELLRCPLYSVTAGDLGLGSHEIETELTRIMSVAQTWGAVLLLDEADVFLEKRQVQDVARNALVSVFLRLLEYFQGVLFLTTNRVDTFDDAFQSRIHLPLRYEELSFKAKKEIWKMFLNKVQIMEDKEDADALLIEQKKTAGDTTPSTITASDDTPALTSSSTATNEESVPTFNEADLNALARHTLNGRQIKNTVRTAQAIAVNEDKKLSMAHIRRVLDVTEAFDRELKGGTGYEDAMRSYT